MSMSSPYIYINAPLPKRFTPPEIVGEVELDAAGLCELMSVNDVGIASAGDGSVAERLLSVFSHPEVLFGDPTFIVANRQTWLDRLKVFVEKNEPVEFVAMAFPYKVPNPLKTDRQAPDLGEALMLRRLQAVLEAIGAVYSPGARLTILEEGILGRCQGVDPRRIAAYRAGIAGIAALSGIDSDRIRIHSLDDMVTSIPNFEARWIHEQERMRELWQQGDPDVRAAYTTTVAASRTSVPTFDYDPRVLAKAYDPEQTDSALRYVRDYVDKVAHRQFFAYRSLLSLRDSTGYLHDLSPHALKLTVSPKPENLAVLPVNIWSRVLPYHGVPVLTAESRWEIAYLGTLGASYGRLEALHLTGDADPRPIAYRAAE
jgi:pyoverdine/dityrosine biosynthesis protein Dit1